MFRFRGLASSKRGVHSYRPNVWSINATMRGVGGRHCREGSACAANPVSVHASTRDHCTKPNCSIFNKLWSGEVRGAAMQPGMHVKLQSRARSCDPMYSVATGKSEAYLEPQGIPGRGPEGDEILTEGFEEKAGCVLRACSLDVLLHQFNR